MSRRRIHRPVVRTMVSAALLGAIGSFGVAAAAGVPTGQSGVNHLISVRGDTADSLNWAGYAVTPGSGISAVSGTFTVPSVGVLPPGFSASWAGIGGYTTSDLIQAGVSENSAIGGELLGGQYDAWYEILPASETPITGCSGDASLHRQRGRQGECQHLQHRRRQLEHRSQRRRQVVLVDVSHLRLLRVLGGVDPGSAQPRRRADDSGRCRDRRVRSDLELHRRGIHRDHRRGKPDPHRRVASD